ncbi:hypothetical protein ACFL1D_04355 [Candidatus Omnitrophota bacterium]
MNRSLKVIFIFLTVLLFSCPLLNAQLDEESLKDSYRQAINLYQKGDYKESLSIFNEIRSLAPNWQKKQIEKFIELCKKKAAALKEEALTKPQDSWWQLLAAEELGQPQQGSVESLLNEYKGLQDELEQKEDRLKYLNDQLKKLQTDSAAFRIQQLVQENSLLKSKFDSLEENFDKLEKYAEGLKSENSRILGLEKQLISLSEQLQEKNTTIESLSSQLANLKGSIIDKDSDYLSLKKEVQEKTAEFNASLKEKDSQIDYLDEQVNGLGKMLTAAKKLQEENLLLSEKIKILNNQLLAPDPEKDNLLEANKELAAELKNKDSLLSKAAMEKEKLTAELNEKESLIKQANQRLVALNKEINTFKSEIDELKKGFTQRGAPQARAAQAASVASLPQQDDKAIAKLQENLNLSLEKYKVLENQLKGVKQDYEELQRKLADKENLIARLQAQSRRKTKTEPAKTSYTAEEKGRIEELTGEINRKNELIAQRDKEILSLKQTIQNTYSLLEDISNN